MGWMHGAQPAKQLHQLAAAVEKKQHNDHTGVHIEPKEVNEINNNAANTNTEYPIQSRHKKDKDLLFISSDETRKRDGKDGSRLCTYLLSYIPVSFLPFNSDTH